MCEKVNVSAIGVELLDELPCEDGRQLRHSVLQVLVKLVVVVKCVVTYAD